MFFVICLTMKEMWFFFTLSPTAQARIATIKVSVLGLSNSRKAECRTSHSSRETDHVHSALIIAFVCWKNVLEYVFLFSRKLHSLLAQALEPIQTRHCRSTFARGVLDNLEIKVLEWNLILYGDEVSYACLHLQLNGIVFFNLVLCILMYTIVGSV